MRKTLLKYFVELTGHPISSSLLKKFATSNISKPLVKPFSKTFHINESEMKLPITAYPSLHSFFTRELNEQARKIDERSTMLTSPVDGIINGFGKISKDQTFLIKNHLYDLNSVIGNPTIANLYLDGYYFILYLSPSHYHRIHAPINGKLVTQYTLGGKSYPVNNTGLKWGNQPFSTNFRSISNYETDHGKVAVVKVGALNINSIVTHQHVGDQCLKGQELGYFSFGSTVILFVEKSPTFKTLVRDQTEVKMGEPIGTWV